jgi:hypothetical protein
MIVPFIPGCSRRFTIEQRLLVDVFSLLLDYDMFYAVQNVNEQNRTLVIQIGFNPLIANQHEAISHIETLLGLSEKKAG